MLIEIHLLQNHSPSNLNRDDLGAPKTAWFGGKLRGRISSQCLKRSIRTSELFKNAKALEGHLGTRTKLFPYLVGERLKDTSCSITDERERVTIVDACKNIARAEGKPGKAERGKKADDRPKTPQLVFLQNGHVDEFIRRLERLRGEMPDAYDYFRNPVAVFEQSVRDRLESLETDEAYIEEMVARCWLISKLRASQLFSQDEVPPEGWNPEDPEHLANRLHRLLDTDPKRLKDLSKKPASAETKQLKDVTFKKPKNFAKFVEVLYAPMQLNAVDIALFGRMTTSDAFEDVEAAVEVAHAISTNELQQEVDYFTAVDDMGVARGGAGHVAENQFNSCTYYKYFSIDWNGLVERLAGKGSTAERLDETKKLAAATVDEFIRAACYFVPTGKKKGHANNNLPSAVLVEVKERRIPTNYANAFVRPATGEGGDLIQDSIAKLGQFVGCTAKSMCLPVKKRIWLAPEGHPLEWTDPCSDKQEPQSVSHTQRVPDLDQVLAEIRKAIGVEAAEAEQGGRHD